MLKRSTSVTSVVKKSVAGSITPALLLITSIHVQTSNKTDLQGVADVSGLAAGNLVSLPGLLFNNGANHRG